MRILLASTSTYRRELLARLGLTFDCEAPGIREAAYPEESPLALCQRLALAKAQAVAERHAASLVIGADQVAALDNQVLGKPGTHPRAVQQLRLESGRSVTFHTAACVLRAAGDTPLAHVDTTVVHFRKLTEQEIERYLLAERPYDCAGSFKSEGLGIGLFERVDTQDPSALVGLPLIAVCRLLRQSGISLP